MAPIGPGAVAAADSLPGHGFRTAKAGQHEESGPVRPPGRRAPGRRVGRTLVPRARRRSRARRRRRDLVQPARRGSRVAPTAPSRGRLSRAPCGPDRPWAFRPAVAWGEGRFVLRSLAVVVEALCGRVPSRTRRRRRSRPATKSRPASITSTCKRRPMAARTGVKGARHRYPHRGGQRRRHLHAGRGQHRLAGPMERQHGVSPGSGTGPSDTTVQCR